MGRLEDIAARNRKALKPRPGLIGLARAELGEAFDPSIPVHERRTKQLALLVVGIAVAVVAGLYLWWPSGGAPGGKVHARDGRTVELSSLWEHRRVVVIFYPGAGCDSCTYILSEAEAVRPKLDADVIAISSHTDSRAEQLHERLHLGFEIYVDRTLQVMDKWKVPIVARDATAAALFVVEPGGKISLEKIGSYPTWDEVVAATHGTRAP